MQTYETTLTALADPTRRLIFERLASGPLPVTALAAGLPVSRPAVSQHLRVLKEASLVVDQRVGARRLYAMNPEGLEALRAYLDGFWDRALAAYKVAAENRRRVEVTVTAAKVSKTVVVEASQEKAFQVFTEGIDTWWLRSHHIGETDISRAVLEPKQDGRWYEIGTDGAECEWGRVLVWEPPTRVVLAWQIDATWHYDPSLVTEVEVQFTAEGPGRTRVDLEHRNLERFGDGWNEVAARFDAPGGWAGLLGAFAAAASGRSS